MGRTNAANDVARRLWEVSDEFVSERLTGVWAYQPHFAPWVTFWVTNVITELGTTPSKTQT